MTYKNRPCGPLPTGVLLATGLLALALGPAAAQGPASDSGKAADSSNSDNALTPDRPGFTNGSDTVAPGRIQVELGVARTKVAAANGGAQATDAPQALIRTGLNDKAELRLTLPDYVWPSGSRSGFSNGSVGIRYKFYQSKDGNTKLAFTPSLSVPVRSAVTSSGHVDPVLSLNGQTTSGARWGLSSNLILSYPTQNGGRVTDYTATGAVTYTLTSQLSVYGDYYYDAPVGSAPSPIADGGFTYKAAKNVQLDIETGRGLGGAAPHPVLRRRRGGAVLGAGWRIAEGLNPLAGGPSAYSPPAWGEEWPARTSSLPAQAGIRRLRRPARGFSPSALPDPATFFAAACLIPTEARA